MVVAIGPSHNSLRANIIDAYLQIFVSLYVEIDVSINIYIFLILLLRNSVNKTLTLTDFQLVFFEEILQNMRKPKSSN